MYREVGINVERAHRIILALDEGYTSDVDEVALMYSERVLAGGGPVLQALRLDDRFRRTLIRVMDQGITTRAERVMISRLRML